MNKKRPPLSFLRNLGEPTREAGEKRRERKVPDLSPLPSPPSPREEGLLGAIRRNKRLQKATAPKKDPRRKTADRVREFMSRNSPEGRDVPSPFEGSIYGDDDESEN